MSNRIGKNFFGRLFGFTLVELLVVISVISVLFALLLPAVQSVREASRRSSCSNKMRQLTLAAQSYHDVYGLLPAGCDRYGSPYDSDNTVTGPFGTRRTSGFVRLLPFLEQNAAFDAIASLMSGPIDPTTSAQLHQTEGFVYTTKSDTADSNNPLENINPRCYSIHNFPEEVRIFDANFMACPSDHNANKIVQNGNIINGDPAASNKSRSGSYVQNIGDVLTLFSGIFRLNGQEIMPNGRSPIGKYYEYSFESITDGTSNTAIFTERCAGSGGNQYTTSGGGNIRQFVILNVADMLSTTVAHSDNGVDMYQYSPQSCMSNHTIGNYIRSDQSISGFGGTAWYDGWSPYTWATFITPPNTASCFRFDSLVAGYNSYGPGLFPATSYHANGVNVAKTDGSVSFVSDTVYCGNKLNGGTFYDRGFTRIVTGESDFGIWGALSSRDGNETATLP